MPSTVQRTDPSTGFRWIDSTNLLVGVNRHDTALILDSGILVTEGSALEVADRAVAWGRRRTARWAVIGVLAAVVLAMLVLLSTPGFTVSPGGAPVAAAVAVLLASTLAAAVLYETRPKTPPIDRWPDAIQLPETQPWQDDFGRCQELLHELTPEDRDLLVEARRSDPTGSGQALDLLLDRLLNGRYSSADAVAASTEDLRARVNAAHRAGETRGAGGEPRSRRVHRSLVEANAQGTALRVTGPSPLSEAADTLVVRGDAHEMLDRLGRRSRALIARRVGMSVAMAAAIVPLMVSASLSANLPAFLLALVALAMLGVFVSVARVDLACRDLAIDAVRDGALLVDADIPDEAQDALFDRLSTSERDALFHSAPRHGLPERDAVEDARDRVIAELAANHRAAREHADRKLGGRG